MTAAAPTPLPEFSHAAVDRLDRALQLYLSSWDETRHESLRNALTGICREAHAAKLGPERMLIAVKSAWTRVPGIDRVDATRAEVAFGQVVGFCIDAYYAEAP